MIFFTEMILGIKPLESGFKTFEFAPDLFSLSFAKGSAPTPYGLIEVELSRDAAGAVKSYISAPEGARYVRI